MFGYMHMDFKGIKHEQIQSHIRTHPSTLLGPQQ